MSKSTLSTPRRLEHLRLGVRVVGDDLDAEGLRLGRHQPRNVAEADQAEHRSFDAADRHHRRHFPAAALHQFVGERDLADQRQQQRHGVVGDLADAVVRHVVDRDAFLLGGGQIDIVDAQAEAADHLAFGELGEDLARELGISHQNRVSVLGDGKNVVGIGAFRHAKCRIEPRQRRFGWIERWKNAIGDSNYSAGHCKLQIEASRTRRNLRQRSLPVHRPPGAIEGRDHAGFQGLTACINQKLTIG